MVLDPFQYSNNVILCNGDFPTAKLPLQVLKRAQHVICCDGAANNLIECGKIPDAIVGDGDSISPMNKEKYADIYIKYEEQETNDQTKAITYLMSKNVKSVSILGATGKREDHTLGNISLLVEYFKMGMNVKMFTDHGVFIPIVGNNTFATFKNQQISIFNFDSEKIEAVGLKYPVRKFTNWWQGTLNEATSTELSLKTDSVIIIFFTYEPKL